MTRTGTRLYSACCTTQVVLMATYDTNELRCGGHPMLEAEPAEITSTPVPGQDTGTQLGKRYVDEESGVSVLCVRGGTGSLSVAGRDLLMPQAKLLPSSD